MEDLHKELRFAAIWTVILDVTVWLCSLLVTEISLNVPFGLLLGSAGMLCNLLLLRRTIQNAVYHGKTRDMIGYLIRILVASAVIAAGLLLDGVNAVAAVLPFLYPKLIFGFLAMHTGKSNKNGGM